MDEIYAGELQRQNFAINWGYHRETGLKTLLVKYEKCNRNNWKYNSAIRILWAVHRKNVGFTFTKISIGFWNPIWVDSEKVLQHFGSW